MCLNVFVCVPQSVIVWIWLCTSLCVSVCVRVCVYVCVCLHVVVYMYVFACVCIFIYVMRLYISLPVCVWECF